MASGPAELGHVGAAEMRQAGDGQGKRAQPGPGVQADEDQGPDARGQQAGHQDHAQHRAAQAGRLHEQERAENGRSQQGADGGEASRGRQHQPALLRHIAPGQPQEHQDQAAAEHDERHLRPEDGTEDQRGQGGQDDSGELGGRGCPVHLEAAGRRGTAITGQVPDRRRRDQATHRQHRQRPPHRRGLETQAVRQVGEDLLLQVVDQRQEPVRCRRDRYPEDSRHEQQPDIAAGPQESAGIRHYVPFPSVSLTGRGTAVSVAGSCPAGSGAANSSRLTRRRNT